MNTDTVKGKWTELKGELQSKWGKLTNDDLEQTKGNVKAIAGLIRQHYGDFKEDLMENLHNMFEKSGVNKAEDIKNDLRQARDSREGRIDNV